MFLIELCKYYTEQCNSFDITNEEQLIRFHDKFISNSLIESFRRALKDTPPKERPEAADAFRKYEKLVVDKYLEHKTKLNVV
jgi:hypothetical protein